MTRGISEEQLKQYKKDTIWCQRTLQELIAKCTELDPWIPIESAPEEHKRVLIRFDDGQREVARLVNGEWTSNDGLDYDYGFEKPTHWCELPGDPK